MKYIYIFITFILFSSTGMTAAEVTLSGTAKDYAGKVLSLKRYADQILRNEETLAETTVDSSGYFSLTVDVPFLMQAFIPTGLSNQFIFLEPGKNYNVALPAYAEKTLPQQLDPYFKPDEFLLHIVGIKEGDFNYQLMEFEEAFDFFTMKHLIHGGNRDSVEASIQQMRAIFADLTDEFQKRFMEYRFLLLSNMFIPDYQDSVIGRLNQIGADPYNPAFWDIFENVFADFIQRTRDNREEYLTFSKIIEEENAKMFFSVLKNRYNFSDAYLCELVAIQWIYDLVNANVFDKVKVINLLQKLSGGIQSEQNRELLASAVAKATANFIGTPAFDFAGIDPQNKTHKLSDFNGKYIYLNIGNSQLDQTKKDLNVLLRFYETYKKELVILNLFLYDTPGQVARIAHPYKDKMIFLYIEDSDLLRKIYDIQNIPSYFLLDKNGDFLMSKGAEPNDELRIFMQQIIIK